MTLAEKILAAKSNRSYVVPGQIVTVPVDCAMMTDILGPRMFKKEFDEIGRNIKNPDSVVIIADHYTPSATEYQAQIVSYSRKWAKDNNIKNFYELEGPCHQILAEKGFSYPGNILVGTDSHTCTSGAFGCFGTGIGSTEMLKVVLTGEIWLKVPESIRVNWNGKLQKGVMAKDVILKTIGTLGHDGATYKALEFSGNTISDMPMDERMCISNMAVEAGAKAGLIPADEKTVEYLRQHNIKNYDNVEFLRSDDDAKYYDTLNFDVNCLEPMVACPHEVDNVCTVREASGVKLDQVYIGSCTGGRMSDLRIAAEILKGKKIANGCRLLVSPASKSIWIEALREGILEILYEAGATILASTCGACLGLHSGTIGKGETCLSTTNRNFTGRMGSKYGNIYLSSSATAAVSALEGKITDPKKYL